ncbi:MAG: hypothetical protein RLY43_2576 [Bacteroidota bacterium]|jgi:hypothetical protein|nr:carboxypeptidase-like regulatory domain-containing protein [uncultured Flavobacterium sp.]
MNRISVVILLLFSYQVFAQTDSLAVKIKAKLVSVTDHKAISGVTVINKTSSLTTVSDENGNFELLTHPNDVLFFSHIAYSFLKIEATPVWIATLSKQISLAERTNEIEAVLITGYQLTGYLEIDTKLIPVNENRRFNIAGLNLGYEPGSKAPKAAQNMINALSNPVDLVYSLFNKSEKDVKRLMEIKKDENFKKILSQQTDREAISMLLQLSKSDIAKILEKCNYSKVFIDSASDLQVLDALATAYEEYKVVGKIKSTQ